MNGNSLLEELEAAIADGKEFLPIPEPIDRTPKGPIIDRLYRVVGFKLNQTEAAFEKNDVTIRSARAFKKSFKKQGCYRVDILESTTTLRNRKDLTFDPQTFEAANDKFVPEPIVIEKPEFAQSTIAWNVIDEKPDTWLDNRPIVKVADRNAKRRAEQKRYQMAERENRKNAILGPETRIYDRANNNLMFSGSERDAASFILSQGIKVENIVIYVGSKLYERLVK